VTDWQLGDRALCIKLGEWTDYRQNGVAPNGSKLPQPGAVYEVDDVIVQFGEVFLHLTGFHEADFYWAKHFRKISDHTPDAEDAETIRLLTGVPVREDV